jgi:hypothetical protein
MVGLGWLSERVFSFRGVGPTTNDEYGGCPCVLQWPQKQLLIEVVVGSLFVLVLWWRSVRWAFVDRARGGNSSTKVKKKLEKKLCSSL